MTDYKIINNHNDKEYHAEMIKYRNKLVLRIKHLDIFLSDDLNSFEVYQDKSVLLVLYKFNLKKMEFKYYLLEYKMLGVVLARELIKKAIITFDFKNKEIIIDNPE